MAKLTRAQRQTLVQVQESLTWALAYLDQPKTLVARTVEWGTLLDYVPRSGVAAAATARLGDKVPGLTTINKEIGSPLAGFRTALGLVQRAIEQDDRARGVRAEEP